MSVVTSIIISISCHEEDFRSKFYRINLWLEANNHLPLYEIEYIGGEKNIVADLLIGSFNLLDLEGFKNFLSGLDWTDKAGVQLLVMESSRLDQILWRDHPLWDKEPAKDFVPGKGSPLTVEVLQRDRKRNSKYIDSGDDEGSEAEKRRKA